MTRYATSGANCAGVNAEKSLVLMASTLLVPSWFMTRVTVCTCASVSCGPLNSSRESASSWNTRTVKCGKACGTKPTSEKRLGVLCTARSEGVVESAGESGTPTRAGVDSVFRRNCMLGLL